FKATLVHGAYSPGSLILIRNKHDEGSLSKEHDCYLGPFEVICQTRNGAYIIKELDGIIFKQHIAAFRVIFYIARSPEYISEIMEKLAEDELSSGTDFWISESSEEFSAYKSD
ncbi:uncharacterized protein PHACADRAFT_81587, partial [Phanerochaete carnosa HHB-10118-sp]